MHSQNERNSNSDRIKRKFNGQRISNYKKRSKLLKKQLDNRLNRPYKIKQLEFILQ